MRSLLVVLGPPVTDQLADLLQIAKQKQIEHFVAQAAVETLDKGVLFGLPGSMSSMKMPLTWRAFDPMLVRAADEEEKKRVREADGSEDELSEQDIETGAKVDAMFDRYCS